MHTLISTYERSVDSRIDSDGGPDRTVHDRTVSRILIHNTLRLVVRTSRGFRTT